MNILCAGLNHHTAPVEIRERFAVGGRDLGAVLDAVREIEGIDGAVVVSTCNRVEIFASSETPRESLEGLDNFLAIRADCDATLIRHGTARAVRHLFRVASGLDSMVLGETEILGQVKQAYAAAAAHGAVSGPLHKLFQHAFRVAKHVRTETRITRGAVSVGAVAAELAENILGGLDGRRVLILGAGDTSERTARSLVARGVLPVIVSNRTYDRAVRIAGDIGGRAIHFEEWPALFADIDIIVSSTAAPHPILTREKLEPLMAARAHRPVFVIDLAVPRDAEPSVAELAGVVLYDIDSLEDIVRQSLSVRRGELVRCEQMIADHVASFLAWLRQREGVAA